MSQETERLVAAATKAIDENADRYMARDDWEGEARAATVAVLKTLRDLGSDGQEGMVTYYDPDRVMRLIHRAIDEIEEG